MDLNNNPLRGWPAETPISGDFGRGFSCDLGVLAYCAEEVRRQQDTPWHVYRMMLAWDFARDMRNEKVLTHNFIREVAKYIDEANADGYRQGDVWIGGRKRTPPSSVHTEMSWLLDNQHAYTPEGFYLQFELIHPFADGNGRTGKVLYNFLKGTLLDPVWPPDFFGGIENP